MSQRAVLLSGLCGLASLAGCLTVGPDYARPDYPLPDSLRGGEREATAEPIDVEATFGDLPWFEAFGDPVLQDLVRTALIENYDVRIAAERVLLARARLTITRADRLPDLQAVGAYENAKITETGTNRITIMQRQPSYTTIAIETSHFVTN